MSVRFSSDVVSQLDGLRTRFMDEVHDVRDFFTDNMGKLLTQVAELEEENERLRDQLESIKDRYADVVAERNEARGKNIGGAL
jgi:regulator of replication initiation timing